MSWNQIRGSLRHLSGHARSVFRVALQGDDSRSLADRRRARMAVLQKRYHGLKDDAQHDIDSWVARVLLGDRNHESSNDKAKNK